MRADRSRLLPALAVVLATVLAAPACSTSAPDPATGQAAAVAELDRITQTRNAADDVFVQHMIPHHEQGVELADLVATRTDTLAVRDMAFRITRAQGFEIGQLRGYLTAWGSDQQAGHTDMASMPGMVAPDRMASVRAATGPAFDRLWLESMIAHHEGAVAMAEAQQRDGVNRGVRNTASNVIAVQRAEIATMRGLLSGGPRS